MKEILFRGYCTEVNHGTWLCGGIVFDDRDMQYRIITKTSYSTGSCFSSEQSYRVLSETVGQFTGLTDKNGVKIFEGDIVQVNYRYGLHNDKIKNENLKVLWDEGSAGFDFSSSKLGIVFIKCLEKEYEVIGNIHDNPELLKG